MNFTNSEILNVNGQRYRAGWDEHGYFSILAGELDEDDIFHSYPGGETYPVNLDLEAVETVRRLMDEGP